MEIERGQKSTTYIFLNQTREKSLKKWGLIILVPGLICFIVGISLLCTMYELYTNEYVVNYTNCTSEDDKVDNFTCPEFMRKFHKECICYLDFSLPKKLKGNITVYYELDEYDQTNSSYVNSRDDEQLSGVLSMTPSKNCEPYRYDEKKPIAPCGAIADAMFNDTFDIGTKTTEIGPYFPVIYTGLMSENDKSAFHNPPGDLKVALQNFTKPKNWSKSIWEINASGFEYEPFIGWMHTNWKRKPMWRINQTDEKFSFLADGLPNGSYLLRVGYNYPLTRYDGSRKIILVGKYTVFNKLKQIFGAIILGLGLLCFLSAGTLYFLKRRKSL